MAAAITVIIASALGLPVSTTHVTIGAVFGVGLFREWYTARRASDRIQRPATQVDEHSEGLSAAIDVAVPVASAGKNGSQSQFRYLVRRSYIASIVAAWVVTVPVSALLGAGLTLILIHLTA